MKIEKVDFNQPTYTGNEITYINQAFQNTHISGDGLFTKKCQAFLECELGVNKAILTTSCTHALEMMALLLQISEGDEIIVPSFTFVSTVNAFVLRGAKPIFIDIKPDTLNFDESLLEKKITHRTKAIIVVHYAGVACNMAEILRIANQYHIPVIEDNAHGLFGKYDNQYLGTFGCMASQSFHETKNFTCGEGGALLINQNEFVERAEIIREKGTDRSRFFRGMVDKYTWVDIGSSYLPSDILAAVLFAQFENWKDIQNKRKILWEHYYQGLEDWALSNEVQLPFVPKNCSQAYHMFYMVMPNLKSRQELIAYLRTKNIHSVFHYIPLHTSGMGLKFGAQTGDCPVTERVSDCLVRLPFYTNLSIEALNYVIEQVRSFDPHSSH